MGTAEFVAACSEREGCQSDASLESMKLAEVNLPAELSADANGSVLSRKFAWEAQRSRKRFISRWSWEKLELNRARPTSSFFLPST